ncbi:MAG: ATP-binding protein [Deltaproteobacteria bacterium]|nr:ATP-binding protein [Deltaproteobacteria bacterium]
MIFLTGPRQIGKTTFAQNWLSGQGADDLYFNWDDPSVVKEYKRNPLFFKNIMDSRSGKRPLPLVFDEIHKLKNWRNILKGIYDANKEKMTLLVTGSARLGWYRKSGDSLVGRYFSYQMLPVGLPEAINDFSHVLMDDAPLSAVDKLADAARQIKTENTEEKLDTLLSLSGFPEPFLKNSTRFYNRWNREYQSLLSKEDIRDLSRISDIKGIEQLLELLPSKVGSLLSINSIAEDIGYHHATITRWLDVLQAIYLVFTLRPWHRNVIRSIKKENKLYFFDWSNVPDAGCRFENLLAVSLIKMAARLTEIGQGTFEIMHIRNKEKQEMDFVLVKNNKPVALFEAKKSDCDISKGGIYFSRQLSLPYYQIVHNCQKVEIFPGNRAVIPATRFLMLTG